MGLLSLSLQWAAKGLRELPSHQLRKAGLRPWLKDQFQSALFRMTLGLVDIAFWFTWLKQRFSPWSKGKGWEDMLQAQLQTMAQEEFGIDIDDKVFIG